MHFQPLLLLVVLLPLATGFLLNKRYNYERDALRRASDELTCGEKPADIVFVMDESGSIWGPDFNKQIKFVEDVVHEFDVSADMTHIGTMTFGSDAKIHFQLDALHGENNIKAAIGQIVQRRGGTKTFDAIKLMRTDMFTSAHARMNLPRIGIVITDGASEDKDKTKAEAAAAHREGITMFAIGVGRQINSEELGNIASSPEFVFKADSYSALDALRKTLAKTACEVTTLPPPTTTSTTTTTTTTTTPPTTTTLPQSIPECDAHFPTDVQFAMSDQAGVHGTDLSLRYINSVAERLTLGGDQALVGVTPKTCDDTADAIRLKDNDNTIGFARSLERRNMTGADTAEHLRYMHNEGISPTNGAREPLDTVRFGILIVDNKAADKEDMLKQAQKARDDDIHLIVLGVGPYVDEAELGGVASTNDDWFHINSYTELDTLTDPIMDRICEIVLQKTGDKY